MDNKHPKEISKPTLLFKRIDTKKAADVGVSVIICTNRPAYTHQIFSNYARQLYKTRELILVLNNNKMNLNRYRAIARRFRDVSVYQLDESTSLGNCINFAISQAKYPIISKFDDDDYYSPYYLNGVMRCFHNKGVNVLGKNTCYLYLKSRNLLVLFHPNRENQFTDMVMGSTLSFRRAVSKKVKFRDVSLGEDTYFFSDCAKEKLKIYSCDSYNYVCIRRLNRLSHTWSIDEKTLLENSIEVAKTRDFTKYITRVVRV